MNTEWKPIESAPKDGSEFLACYGRQGNVLQLVKWNKIHGYFESKGKPELGFTSNATDWMPVSAPTSHPIPTGATGEDEPVAKVRRGHYGGRVGNIGFQQVVLLPGVKVMDNTLLYARPAPAAGDALRLALEALEAAQPIMKHYTEPNERHQRAIEAVRAAIAQQKGEA